MTQRGGVSSSRRDLAAWVLAVLGIALTIGAALAFRPEVPEEQLGTGVVWMLAGLAAFAAALAVSGRLARMTQVPEVVLLDGAGSRWRWFWLTQGLLLLALDTALSAKWFGLNAAGVSAGVQFALLALGIVAVVRGMGGPFRRMRLDARTVLPLGAILVLALVLRVVGLGDTIRTLVDEVHPINGIQHLWWHPADGILTAGSTYLPTTLVYAFWESSAISLFGHNFFGLRLMNALVGTLNVWALYLLARTLFDRTTALAAAFLLATFPPHLHFSRIALAHITDPLFGMLALAFAARGLRGNRRLDWALCGASLGLTQYFFEGGRLLFPPLLLLWLVVLALTTRTHLRPHWRGIGVALLTALIVAAPVYLVILTQGSALTNRMNDAGLGLDYWIRLLTGHLTLKEQANVVLQLTVPFQLFVHLPDQAVYYGGTTPMILTPFVPLALLGLAYVLWRWRTPAILVLFWVVGTAAGNVLLRDSGQMPRFIVVFPALALLMALGLRSMLALLTARLWPGIRVSLLLVLLLAVGAAQASYYFTIHVPTLNTQLRESKQYPDGTDAVLRSLALPANTQIILISNPRSDENVPRALLGFLTTPGADLPLIAKTVDDVDNSYLFGLPHDHNYAFFVQPGYPDVVMRLQRFFRLGDPQMSPDSGVPFDRMYILYFARRGSP